MLTYHHIFVREYLNKALSIMEKVHGPQHPDVAAILISLGENMINVDLKIYDSVKILNRAVAILEPMQKRRITVSSQCVHILCTCGHAC